MLIAMFDNLPQVARGAGVVFIQVGAINRRLPAKMTLLENSGGNQPIDLKPHIMPRIPIISAVGCHLMGMDQKPLPGADRKSAKLTVKCASSTYHIMK